MKKIIYAIISSFVIIIFVLFNFICSSLGGTKETTSSVKKVYYADNISIPLRIIIDNFNRKYKGQIEVEIIDLPFEKFSTNERKELLARYFRNKSERIDVFSVDEIWVPRFAKWARPLDIYFNKGEDKQMLSYALNSCVYKNSLVAVPLYIDIALMYYRNDILARYPNYREIKKEIDASIEWEEFVNIASKTRTGGPFYLFQADDYEGLVCSFIEMVKSQGIDLVENNTIKLNSPEVRKSLQLLVDLVQKYKMTPPEVTHYKEIQTYTSFIDNNGLFLRGWPGFMTSDLKTITKDESFYQNIYKAPLPHFRGYKPASVFGGWSLMVSRFSDVTSEAVTFVKFLLSAESQKILLEKGGYLPVNNSLYDDSVFVKAHPDLAFYKQLFKSGVNRPFSSNYTYLSDVLSYYINRAIRKEITVSEALKQAEEKINIEKILFN